MNKKFINIFITLSVILCIIPTVFAAPLESMEEKSLADFKQDAISNVINIALAQEGYLEKTSNNYLYDKTNNAGSSNYTMFAADLANAGFYQGNLNGNPWCDMFVDWCFVTAFGPDPAKTITNQYPYGVAACVSSENLYKAVGQYYSTPQPGDQIFFGNHTGLVYKVDGNTVYTIEGNTNSSSGVVANGGAVRVKSYPLNASRIKGYGRPNYDVIATYLKTKYDEYMEQLKIEQKKAEIRKTLTNPKSHFCNENITA